MLGQQELLEAPPRRRLIVRKGRGAHWGVDPSSVRVALAGVSRDSAGSLGSWARMASFAALDGPERLSEIYAETRRLTVSVATCCPWPGVVWFEQPSGANVNHPLEFATGVIQAAVYDGLVEVMGSAPHMELVPSSSWKLAACGYGAIYKPTKKKLGRTPVFEDYGVAVWAREQMGYRGNSWDECDALGVAEAARREIALDER